MQIEVLTDDRFDEFMQLVRQMVAEADFKAAEPDSNKIWDQWKDTLTQVFYAEREGKMIGFIAGTLTEYFFSTRKKACDLGFYVLPEHRGGKAAIRLIMVFEGWAKNMGAQDIYIGQTTAVDIERTLRFYAHLGYKPVGVNTVKHLN